MKPWALRRRAFAIVRGLALVSSGLLLVPLLAVRASRLAGDVPAAAGRVLRMTDEERRLAQYGHCRDFGYGYVRRVMDGLPDPSVRPTMRYLEYDRFGDTLVPSRASRRDERIIVGIEVADEDLAPKHLTSRAARHAEQSSTWLFRTINDYDLLLGVRIRRRDPATDARAQFVVFADADARRFLGRFGQEVPGSAEPDTEIRFHEPLTQFSITRGGMDFRIDVDGLGVTALEPVVATVDLRWFTIVQRAGKCFTAVRDDLIEEATRDRAWNAWLSSLRSGR